MIDGREGAYTATIASKILIKKKEPFSIHPWTTFKYHIDYDTSRFSRWLRLHARAGVMHHSIGRFIQKLKRDYSITVI